MMIQRSIPAQRRRDILDQLRQMTSVRSSDLCAILNASEATIRRDLSFLEDEGLIVRTHGGAMLSQRMQNEPPFEGSRMSHAAEKERIGAAAAGLVQNGETVFMNFGTTTSQVAHFLKLRTDLEDVTVVTNNLSVFEELKDSDAFRIILLGGTYRRHSNSLVGTLTTHSISRLLANRAILGSDGVSPYYGCTTPGEQDAEISRSMAENTTGNIILVADSSKWGVISNYRVAAFNRIHTWISDFSLNQEARDTLSDFPLDLRLV